MRACYRMAVCLVLTAIPAICEQNEIVKDFTCRYIYTPPCLIEEINKQVFEDLI
jgi:hypothetical protein